MNNKISDSILSIAFIAILFFVSAQIKVAQTKAGGKKIRPDLFGLFYEDINYSADGGLYAELIQKGLITPHLQCR
jgi:alpha-N-arabinofuranosidase